MKLSLCAICEHYENNRRCAAFPNGIPSEIMFGEMLHLTPREDDGGIIFTPRDKRAAAAAVPFGYKNLENITTRAS